MDDPEIDATVLAEAMGLTPAEFIGEVRAGRITSRVERGEGEDAGLVRVTLFHRGRRLRLVLDARGAVIRRSIIDFGGKALPAGLHRR